MLLFNVFFGALIVIRCVKAQLHPTQSAAYRDLPSLRQQASTLNEWKNERLSRIPMLLNQYDAQVWLMSQREHAEDPIWWSLKNATDFAAHRRTVVLLHTNTSTLAGAPNPLIWVDNTGAIWKKLISVLEAFQPDRIILNVDKDIAFGAGLHVGELQVLHEKLGETWMNRVAYEPMLAVEHLSYRVPGQLHYYRLMQETIWAMIEEAFSSSVIHSGITTTEDVEWWYRDKIQERNLSTWNHPRVSVIKPDSFPGWVGTKDVIREGDLLHVDFGITAMGLNTDTQHMAYVLRPGETDAPEGMKIGLQKSNRMQDIVLAIMRPGLTGNQVLRTCLDAMYTEGIDGQFFSHPIGDWGHAPGAVMGFTNMPAYVPVLGELPILANTYYSIELYAYHYVPERGETLRFRQEENVYWVEEKGVWEFVRGRQERFHLIGGDKNTLQVQ